MTYSIIAEITSKDVSMQLVGMLVVFVCLGGIAILITIASKIVEACQRSAQKRAEVKASKEALPSIDEIVEVVPAPSGDSLDPEVVALIATAVDVAMGQQCRILHIAPSSYANVTPEVVAVIAAAVDATIGQPHRILHIAPSYVSSWSSEGRREIFASHRLR